jgi:periplasmic protein TonB
MPGASQRMAMRVRRRETLVWAVLLSLALHLTLLVFLLLIIPPTEPQANAADPLTVDVVVGEGAAGATSEPAAPTEAAAEPVAPDVPPPPTPAPTPEVPPPPPVQQVELPPPTPEPAPDVPPPPVQQTEIPPPPPVPAPKVPPPPRPVARVRPPVAPPQRVAAVAPVNPAGPPVQAPAGPPAQATEGQNGAGHGGGASTGATWTGKLKQWWDQHSFYPNEASRTNEGGNVRVRIVVAPDGQVISIQVVQGSGMSVLDAAALAVFRNARLPPFPPGTPAPPGDVVVTLHYRPADGGG